MEFKLYIIRHADAQKDHYDRDFEREITPYGVSQCETARKRLRSILPEKGYVLCSAATRTVQTFEELQFAEGWKVKKTEKLYEAEIDILNKVIKEEGLENEKVLVLVGHNPFVSELSSYLSGTRLRMGTCDICCLTCNEEVKSLGEALDMVGCWEASAV